MEAMPQSSVTAESMTVAPAAPAVAASQAQNAEKPFVALREATPEAPQQPTTESSVVAQSDPEQPARKAAESESSAEVTPHADEPTVPVDAKAAAEASA